MNTAAHDAYLTRGNWLARRIRRTLRARFPQYRYREEVRAYAAQFWALDLPVTVPGTLEAAALYANEIRTTCDLPWLMTAGATAAVLREIHRQQRRPKRGPLRDPQLGHSDLEATRRPTD